MRYCLSSAARDTHKGAGACSAMTETAGRAEPQRSHGTDGVIFLFKEKNTNKMFLHTNKYIENIYSSSAPFPKFHFGFLNDFNTNI